MKSLSVSPMARAVLALAISMVAVLGCSRGAPTGTATPPQPARQTGVVTVDIAYLNHAPVLEVLDQVNRVLAKYGDHIKTNRYDLDTPAGEAFAQARHLMGHTPLAIYINGSMDVTEGGHHVRFFSFPQGQGTGMVPEGAWSVAALDAALARATGTRP